MVKRKEKNITGELKQNEVADWGEGVGGGGDVTDTTDR